MRQQNEILEVFKDLSGNWNVTDKYFMIKEDENKSEAKNLWTEISPTDEFRTRFNITSIVSNVAVPSEVSLAMKMFDKKALTVSLNYKVIRKIFSEIESEVKQKLLTEFEDKLIKIIEKDRESLKSEVDLQLFKKEEQVKGLERQVETLEEQTRNLEDCIRILKDKNTSNLSSMMNEDLQNDLSLNPINKTIGDCFFVDKDERSEDFEFIENNFPSKTLKTLFTW